MKKLVYINLDFENYKKKTLSQIKAFIKEGYKDSYIVTIKNKHILLYKVLENLQLTEIEKKKIYQKTKKKRNEEIASEIESIVRNIKPEIVYIRRIDINIIFYKKCISEISSISKLIYEIPTYPFDKTTSIKSNFLQIFELLYLKYVIKKFITIFAVNIQKKCKKWDNMVEIFNGINIEGYEIKKQISKTQNENNSLNLIGIAHLNYWHGYDRIIKTIQKEKNIKLDFTIISNDTDEKRKLMEYVKENKLNNKVHFLCDNQEEAKKKINEANIAIGGIGYHRRGAQYDTSIKNKEYCAMGIPFIVACEDKAFPKDFKYMYKVEANDNVIDFEKILNWYNNIITKENVSQEMHNFAEKNLSFDNSIKKIISIIDKDKNDVS